MNTTLKKLNDRLSIALVSHKRLDNQIEAADGLAEFDLIVDGRRFQTAEYTKNIEIIRDAQNNDAYPETFESVAEALGVERESEEFELTISRLWDELDNQLLAHFPLYAA